MDWSASEVNRLKREVEALKKSLAPVEQVRLEHGRTTRKLLHAESERDRLATEGDRLRRELDCLESTRAEWREELSSFRGRCCTLESECDLHALARSEAVAWAESAGEEERCLEHAALDRSLAEAQVEAAALQARARAEDDRMQVMDFALDVRCLEREDSELRGVLRAARADAAVLRNDLGILRSEHQRLQVDHEARGDALFEEAGACAALRSRCELLQSELAAATAAAGRGAAPPPPSAPPLR
eukprot:TRINITY_DN6743_c0_g1_i1.p1 TRINITY_DN6743_c0_g1~~TRINITY_DN6743_c0_g1_i1.p1  ORF type:complete len:270 (-),score=84.73 TRINITY_DN6743_c0_g1_i1:379-1110(-)